MKKSTMLVLSVAMFMAPTYATADEAVADRLHCDAGLIQVCTTPAADGSGFLVLTDSRARALPDCTVAMERGVDLRCVAEADVRANEKLACESLGDNWRWSARHERCYQHVERSVRNDGGGGSVTTGSGVAIAVPRCTETDRGRLAQELDRIENDLRVVTELGPLQARAAEVYGVAVECDDNSSGSRALIQRAADMVANFEPEPVTQRNWTGEFNQVHQHLDELIIPPAEAEEENWCTDTTAGVFVCIVLPTVVIVTGLGIGAAVLIDYLDDGSPDGLIHW